MWITSLSGDRVARSVGGSTGRSRDKIGYVSASDLSSVPAAELPSEWSESVILLDVREDEEWQHGHAAGAIHIPMAEIPSRIGEVEPDAELFVVCRSGARSLRVVEYLARIGYEASNVDGGMVAWNAARRPIVRDDGAEARIL